MKEWECVEVEHHKDVGEAIERWQENGWHLHAYQATGRDVWVKHYLLFLCRTLKKVGSTCSVELVKLSKVLSRDLLIIIVLSGTC